MSSKLKSPRREEDIPSKYNEFDSEEDQSTLLRTVVEFELFDKRTGGFAYFDDLSDPSRHISLRGFVVEPLPADWRDTINSLLSTAPTEQLDLNKSAISTKKKKTRTEEVVNSGNDFQQEYNANEPQEISVLDWETLTVGDNVDGYCNKTFKWYQAKIVQVDPVKNRFKVHFQGWNSKYDEWVDKYSQRLVPFKTSKKIMEEAVKNASRMVPWYQHTLLMKRAQEVMKKKVPPRHPAYVVIDKLDDWCVDYTYANPTLWLISGENWYRVAGALCPGGCFGTPTDEYRPYFFVALEKYLCAAHLSMILLDQLPTNPGVNCLAVIDEAFNRSGGIVNEVNCLQHYQFIADQLSSIELPSEWGAKITIVKSMFMSQLKRDGEAFVNGGGMGSLLASTYKGPLVKRRLAVAQQYAVLLLELNQGDINSEHFEVSHLDSENQNVDTPKSSKKGRKSKGELQEFPEIEEVHEKVTKKKKVKIEFPLEDSQLWSYEYQESQHPCKAMPLPTFSDQLLDINVSDPKLRFHYHNLLLKIMTTTTNFRNTLKLPLFHLRDLELSISSSTTSVDPLLRQMCIAMLMVIIKAYVQDGSIKTVAGEERRVPGGENDDNDNDCREPLLIEAAKLEETLLKFLQVGDTWIELTKIICEKVDFAEFAIAIEGATNPTRSCQEIFTEITQRFATGPFSHPIDPDLHGLADYFAIIEKPMDFGVIKSRLASGWYEPEDGLCYSNFMEDDSASSCRPEDMHFDATIVKLKRPVDPYFQIGQFVDVYDETLKKWIEAVVEDRDYDSPTDSLSCSSRIPVVTAYWIRRIGLTVPPCASIRIPVNEDRVIFHRTASSEKYRRVLKPSHFFAKYPQHATMNHEEWDSQRLGTHDSSRYRGYRGFAEDMRLVWRNCLKYYDHFGEGLENNEFMQEAVKMEEFFEQEYQRRVTSFAGVDFTKQIPSVLANEQQYYRPAECWKLALKSLVNTESRDIVHDMMPQIDVPEDVEMLHVLTKLKRRSFLDLSVADKIVFLHWLCYSFMDTNFVHSELNTKAQAPKQPIPLKQLVAESSSLLAEEKGTSDEAMDIDEILAEDDAEEIVTRSSTRKARSTLSTSTSMTSLQSIDESDKTPSNESKKRPREVDETEPNMDDSTIIATAPSATKKPRIILTMDESDKGSEKSKNPEETSITDRAMVHRHDCLGCDRFGNRYWVFSDHCTHVPTLFCEVRFQVGVPAVEYTVEQPNAPGWVLYSNHQDIWKLVCWLDERGVSEAMLLRSIYEWIRENVIELPKTGIPAEISNRTIVETVKTSERKRKTDDRLAYELISNLRKLKFRFDSSASTKDPGAASLSSEEIRLRAHHFLPLTNQSTRFFVLHVEFSAQAKQLGMGVKAASDGTVYVTSFVTAESITKKAGFCVGDCILFAGARLRPNVPTLVDLVKTANFDIDQDPSGKVTRRLSFMVRRMMIPTEDPMFRAIADKDPDIIKQCNQHKDEREQELNVLENNFLSNSNAKDSIAKLRTFNSKMQEQPGCFNEVLTIFMELWLKLAHPAFTTHYFRATLLEGWLAKLLEVISDFPSSSDDNTSMENIREGGSLLCQFAARAMLDLEWDLYRVGSVLRDNWLGSQIGLEGDMTPSSALSGSGLASAAASSGMNNGPPAFVPGRIAVQQCHSRKRQQWRQFCRTGVHNVETWSYALATFMYHAVDWELFQRQLIPIPADRIPHVLQQVGMEEDFVRHLLKEGNRLVYFGDGHAESNRADRDLYAASHQQYFHVLADQYFRRPNLHGKVQASGVGRLLPFRRSTVLWGDSLPPQAGIVLLCQIAKAQVFHTTIPFVQLTLNILSPVTQNYHIFPAPGIVPSNSNQSIAVCRHLLRILHFVKRNNACKPFLTPVSADEYPTYMEVIQQPIDLGIIEKKITNQQYSHHTQFLDDMQLLYQNCSDFCGAESKVFPPVARAMLRDAQRLCRKYFDANYVEGNDAADNAQQDVADGLDALGGTEGEEEDRDEGKDSNKDVGDDTVSPSPSQRPSLTSSPVRQSDRQTTDSASSSSAQLNNTDDGVPTEDDRDKEATASANGGMGASGSTAAADAPTTAASLASFKTMTVAVRLDRLWPTFLIEQDIYTRCVKHWNASMITANKTTVRVEIAPDRQGNPRYATGVIVGNKEPVIISSRNNSTARVMPWEFIQVDWTEPADAILMPTHVNFWDVDLTPDK